MTLAELRYLVAVADLSHFGRAAERCRVTQPTLSSQLRKLEENLGVPLVERTTRFVTLTPIGKAVVAHARRILEEADRIFQAEVAQPALSAAPGLAQLVAVCEAFFDYLQRRTFPGGCFFAAAALEMGTRPGPVKERVADFQSGFGALVRGFAATALEQHELPAHEDPDRLAFELYGIMLAADTSFVLHDDPAVLNLARQIIRQRLGLGNGGNAGES